jgi:hypothetical protein
LRQRTARGLFPAGDAWTIARVLLASPGPEARIAGLSLTAIFAADVAAPAARPLLDDADPEVAAAARVTLEAIEGTRRTDEMRGGSD